MCYIEDVTIEGRKKEISIKLKRIRTFLEENELIGVVLNRHSNYSWITAGEKSSVTLYLESGIASVLITQHKTYVITNVIEVPRLREEQKIEELGFEIVSQEWYENKTVEIITSLVGGDYSKIATDMPMGELKVMNTEIDALRFSLTDNEIARYQYLGDTLSEVLEKYIVTVKPGMTEYEIAGGLSEALWKYNIEQVLYLVSADERAYKYRHGIPTDKVLGKHLNVSVNGRYKGLVTTVTRMAHFGKCDARLQKQFDDTCEIECRAIAAIKVGVDDISGFNACKKAYETLGYADMWRVHSQGGAQGYHNRDYTLTDNIHKITVENQGYCFNPVIDGTKTEDAFIATKEGPLFITKPKTFPVIEKEINQIFFRRPGLVFIDS